MCRQPEKRRHTLPTLGLALVLFGCCGCAAHLATVKTKAPALPATVASETPLSAATKLLTAAEREPPHSALANDLSAARISCKILESHPQDEAARNTYNFAVARTVENCA